MQIIQKVIWAAGLLDQSLVREFLHGPLFEVQVHDHDRIIHKLEEGSSLFGEERDDDLLSVPNKGSHFPFRFFHFLATYTHRVNCGHSISFHLSVCLSVCISLHAVKKVSR